jgi:aspartate racemase
LEASGAGLVVIACNAAHFFHADIQKSVSIPVRHIMREVGGEIQRSTEQWGTVGLLAGTTTVKTGLYDNVLQEIGVRVFSPDVDEEQEIVNNSIYEIKKGNKGVKQILIDIAEKMASRGAQAIILGCTEIPLVIQEGNLSVPVIDATQVLADAAIRMAKAGG